MHLTAAEPQPAALWSPVRPAWRMGNPGALNVDLAAEQLGRKRRGSLLIPARSVSSWLRRGFSGLRVAVQPPRAPAALDRCEDTDGEGRAWSPRAYGLQTSTDGTNWTTVVASGVGTGPGVG